MHKTALFRPISLKTHPLVAELAMVLSVIVFEAPPYKADIKSTDYVRVLPPRVHSSCREACCSVGARAVRARHGSALNITVLTTAGALLATPH